MVTNAAFRKLAMSFPEAKESQHFNKTSFGVKKIFATLDEKEGLAVVNLSLVDQSVFTDASKGAIYPVQGKWGKSGFTYIDLKKVKRKMMEDALTISYCNTAPKKLAERYLRALY